MNDSLQTIIIKTIVKAQALEKSLLLGQMTEEQKKKDTVKLVKDQFDEIQELYNNILKESGAI